MENDIPWPTVFAAILYEVWRLRNLIVYNKATFDVNFMFCKKTRQIATGFNMTIGNMHGNTNHSNNRTTFFTKWIPPPIGWVKCYSDGSVCHSTSTTACAGTFRDHYGNCQIGYKVFRGKDRLHYSSYILTSLEVAWTMGIRKGCHKNHRSSPIVYSINGYKRCLP